MPTHQIEPIHGFVHYDFSRERKPALWIESGDTVVMRTLDAGAHLEPWRSDGTPGPRMDGAGNGHALCGPIGVRGARAGQTIAIELIDIVPGTWGMTGGGGFTTPLNERLGLTDGEMTVVRWTLDPSARTAVDQFGHRVELRPFLGVIGMPPDEPGSHPTGPPRACGGNLDCKELVAGSTLYLPTTVDGALVSLGDGHGRQGDGEVSGMAIECPMDRVEVRISVSDEPAITWPRASTPAGWIAFGVHERIDEAIHIAIDGMLDLLVEHGHCADRKQAIALASIVVDVRVTQLVNGVVGAHAVLPHDALV